MTVIQQPVSPNLPLAPGQYDSRYQEQFNNVLRLYFNRLNNNLLSLFNTYGGQYLNFPFGSFFDVGNQVAVSTTTAYAVRLNNTSYANGVSVVDDSKITFSYSGVYNIQFSIQMANYDNGEQDIDIWFRKNGVDIPNSNSRFGQVPRKSVGVPSHIIGTVNLFVDVIEGDYVELYWQTTDTDTYIQYYGPDTSPTRPAIPSVILTVSFVSSTSGIVTTGTSVALSGVSSSGSVGTVTP
jgi:hypothetical protein